MTNIVLLAGNIGNEPETATTRGGTRITDFRLATSRPRRVDGKVVKGENGYAEQDTEWHRVKCFNGLAETVQKHCVKGMKVAVRGRIHYTQWKDSEGVERYGSEIIADGVEFLAWPKQRDTAGNQTEIDDEIPF
ncbi:single-stranded DNA-binding protein [Mesorhizobium sp. M1A.F.Ca.IN.022.05.2.1]|uniref:single-stranded DNA-binding protein n=1 Tax=unclassified Mesorhizobium TaxID=325217 RepID=UPI000FCBDF2D|nr:MULTISPECIES: single-stranded DNA-binding protein [unclassified Mesorhizobium]RUV80464.1 single-stranded DNA-binding protein [Mesorhizobium sp. M1A.F.Ca.IN.020.32.1.1]RUW00948.1 single-stranded DNA-binding protein [Mesorhizobium sp. M1A.F.Ca.IN.022.05.2.1]RWF83110.1 MAG: single-stranded DNA-binding protein [Mesorhizobium sp.]RWG06690.1 MAG: single-stranded DNA-binding protein [Mesorhizobium sp.]RWG84393.1 MAG: single-stranded DNA-binding protein [Mesorhizobium sp.]